MIRVTLQLSENVAATIHEGRYDAGQRELEYPTPDGEWVQFSFGGLMDQSWLGMAGFDPKMGLWYTPDGHPWSDIIVSLDNDNGGV